VIAAQVPKKAQGNFPASPDRRTNKRHPSGAGILSLAKAKVPEG